MLARLSIFSFLFFSCFAVKSQEFIEASSELPEIVKTSNNSMDVAVADINGDGDPDLVIAVEFFKNVILLNDGSGKFSDASSLLPDLPVNEDPKPYSYYPCHDSEDIAIANFDQDGDLDIIFVTEDDKTNEYYINNGQSFENRSNQLPFKGISNAIITADFDSDSFQDLIVGNNGQNFYIKNDHGRFIDETAARLPKSNDITQDVEANDFDQDGDLDLIIGNEKENKLLLNDGNGQFTDVTSEFIKSAYLALGETREADFGDLNGDGKTDLFFAYVELFQGMEPVQRLLIQTESGFDDQTMERLGFTDLYSIMDIDMADIDNDNDLDLLFATLTGPRLMLNDGKGYFKDITSETFGDSEVMGIDIEAADLNADGKLDIYLANFRAADRLFIQK
ncbi:VCBS repeat-containing protein [Gramella sp. BOM4]|nr:VCBS repeat-containing protein [Christiangramia bathymodioli]